VGRIVRIRPAIGYTLATGFVCAPFVAYLGSAKQIFQDTYGTGALFPLYFGVLALSFGAGSLVNSRLVMKYGMRRLSKSSAAFIATISLIASAALFAFDGLPPFWLFMAYLLSVFVSVSLLFGNLNALAMQPLGHIAGIGAAVIASVSTFVSVPLGAVVGQSFDGTLYALVGAFAVSSAKPIVDIPNLTRHEYARSTEISASDASESSDELERNCQTLVRIVDCSDLQGREVKALAEHVDADDDTASSMLQSLKCRKLVPARHLAVQPNRTKVRSMLLVN